MDADGTHPATNGDLLFDDLRRPALELATEQPSGSERHAIVGEPQDQILCAGSVKSKGCKYYAVVRLVSAGGFRSEAFG
jgi:hypothetical protein